MYKSHVSWGSLQCGGCACAFRRFGVGSHLLIRPNIAHLSAPILHTGPACVPLSVFIGTQLLALISGSGSRRPSTPPSICGYRDSRLVPESAFPQSLNLATCRCLFFIIDSFPSLLPDPSLLTSLIQPIPTPCHPIQPATRSPSVDPMKVSACG